MRIDNLMYLTRRSAELDADMEVGSIDFHGRAADAPFSRSDPLYLYIDVLTSASGGSGSFQATTGTARNLSLIHISEPTRPY